VSRAPGYRCDSYGCNRRLRRLDPGPNPDPEDDADYACLRCGRLFGAAELDAEARREAEARQADEAARTMPGLADWLARARRAP
jgi:DNA-directed RNA polymerase subunit RPC12/RpoP